MSELAATRAPAHDDEVDVERLDVTGSARR